MIMTMSPFNIFLSVFFLICIGLYISDYLRKRKNVVPTPQIYNHLNYDPDCWIYTQRNIVLTDTQLERLERRLKYDLDCGVVYEKSLLYYLLKTRKVNPIRENESIEQYVLRSLKNDFEENNGISFDKFIEGYNKILLDTPEKLL